MQYLHGTSMEVVWSYLRVSTKGDVLSAYACIACTTLIVYKVNILIVLPQLYYIHTYV